MLSREAEAFTGSAATWNEPRPTARRFDVEYHSRLESESARTATLGWDALLFSSGDVAAYRERYGAEVEGSLLTFLILDEANPNSIRSCIAQARENARSIRDQNLLRDVGAPEPFPPGDERGIHWRVC